MEAFSSTAGIIILGLVAIVAGFIPTYLALYKKNSNTEGIIKLNAIAVLGIGILGMALSFIFQAAGVSDKVWALVILIVLELIRLAAWVYLLILAIKDNETPIF